MKNELMLSVFVLAPLAVTLLITFIFRREYHIKRSTGWKIIQDIGYFSSFAYICFYTWIGYSILTSNDAQAIFGIVFFYTYAPLIISAAIVVSLVYNFIREKFYR